MVCVSLKLIDKFRTHLFYSLTKRQSRQRDNILRHLAIFGYDDEKMTDRSLSIPKHDW